MPKPRVLLKESRNVIYRKIVELGLDRDEFSWSEPLSAHSANSVVSRIDHDSSESYFIFDWKAGYKPYYICSPGFGVGYAEGECEDQLSVALEWLALLKKEITTPDLWEILKTPTS